MRIPVIAGNWKMHKTLAEARALSQAIRDGAAQATHCQIVLAPPYSALAAVAEVIRGTPLILAAQNVHWEAQGAFTGEISIPMLEDAGLRHGHSRAFRTPAILRRDRPDR